MMMIFIEFLFDRCNKLHKQFWDSLYHPVYGAWCTTGPKYFFVFMNPTARNISSHHGRNGLRCPRVWLKQIWNMFYELGLLSKYYFDITQSNDKAIWTSDFVYSLYSHLAEHGVYITNLAKCTQSDAKPLHNNIFRKHLDIIYDEINAIKPENIISFWNQVSSILLGKNISVSWYEQPERYEILTINNSDYKIYPCFYPVWIWFRNMNKSITKIASLL